MNQRLAVLCMLAFAWMTLPAVSIAQSDPLLLLRDKASVLSGRLIEDASLIQSQPHYLEQMISEQLGRVVDYRYMCRKALGKYWKRASISQKKEFESAFKRKLIRTYAYAFKSYQGQKIHFGPTRSQDNNTDRALIRSHLEVSNNKVELDYRLHHQDGRWQVYDILIDGSSLVTTFSDQIQQLIKQHGVARAISKLSREYPDDRRTIALGSDNWGPYASENLPDKGLAAAIVSTVLEHLGYRVSIEFSPWKKLVGRVNEGKLDGLLATWPNQTPEHFALSESYLESELRFIKRLDDPFVYQNPTQLRQFMTNKSYRLGIFSSYNYQDYTGKITEQFDVQKLDYCSQLFREVANNNIDLALVDRWIADNELASKDNIAEHLTVVPKGIAQTTIHLALNGQTDSPALLDGFNKILNRIRQSGEYQNLLSKHQYPHQ